MSVDENELLAKIEPLKRAAKIPPIVETGRYTMVVPYVELVKVIKEIADVCEEIRTDTTGG